MFCMWSLVAHPLQPLIQEFLGKTWKQVEKKTPLIKYADSPEGEAGDNKEYTTGLRGKSLQGDSAEKSKGKEQRMQAAPPAQGKGHSPEGHRSCC